MNKISIENAEKLSPQELVELIINNVPYNNIRNCLSNLEKVPIEEETVVPPVEPVVPLGGSSSVETTVVRSEVDRLRDMCKNEAILIVETGRVIPGKDQPQVIFYAKNKKDNKLRKFSIDQSKFSEKTCTKYGEPIDDACTAILEWIDDQVENKGKNITEVRKVVQDYLSSGINLYLTKCPQFDEIKIKLGMQSGTSEAKKPLVADIPVKPIEVPEPVKSAELPDDIFQLSIMLTPNSDYLVFPEQRKNGKFLVSFYDSTKDAWVSKETELDFIKTTVAETPAVEVDSPEYRLREDALSRLQEGTAKFKNLKTIVDKIVSSGISLPYEFLNRLL